MERYKLELEFESEVEPSMVIRNVERYIDSAISNYCLEDAEVDTYTVQCYKID